MQLSAGARLGSYAIKSTIGAGGMGEVYCGHDTRLNRDVALKILPERFAIDPDRLARFKREAQVLASLNHPHIAAIFGFEEVDGVHALVLELIDGPTLAEHIRHGPMPVAQALDVARQIADALDAAHERGIVHRDLKPSNVKMTADGRVKVLDFGLAKLTASEAVDGAASLTHSPTATIGATRAGILLGTAAYMSPEQARGKPVDKRADIWAFGCLLYEMVTGDAPFAGESVTDTLAQILERPPQWHRLPATLPSGVRHVLERCLEKDPRRRLRDIGDAIPELTDVTPRAGAVGGAEARRVLPWAIPVAIAALVGIAVIIRYAASPSPRTPAAQLWRFAISPPPGTMFFRAPNRGGIALSPDSSTLAFTAYRDGQIRLWVQRLDAATARELLGSDGAHLPFWSPDGRSVAFFAGNRLKRIDVDSGRLQVLCDAPTPQGGTWGRDGTVLFAAGYRRLFRVPATGGMAIEVSAADEARTETDHVSPQFLPDGRRFLYTIRSRNEDVSGLYVGSLDEPALKIRILPFESWVSVATDAPPTVYLAWARSKSTLVARRWNSQSMQFEGDAVPIATPIGIMGDTPEIAVASGALLVHGPPVPLEIAWVDRHGRWLGRIGESATLVNAPRLSPDGRRVVAGRDGSLFGTDLARGLTSRLAANVENRTLMWSPDGSQVAFSGVRNRNSNVIVRLSDGTGDDVVPAASPATQTAISWLSNDSLLLLEEDPASGRQALARVALSGARKRETIRAVSHYQPFAELSPDRQWLAYASDETERTEVYLEPLAGSTGSGRRMQVSSDGGNFPRWRRDGKELFYSTLDGQLMAVAVKTAGDSLELGAPMALFSLPTLYNGSYSFDVGPDAERFLAVGPTRDRSHESLTAIVNWRATFENPH